jgi:hypothetical protein
VRSCLVVLWLSLLALPASAQVREWDLSVYAGVGSFFGSGWDANRPGGSLAVSGGPRFHKVFALHAMLLQEGIRMRAAEEAHRHGEFFALMVAPEIHPLGKGDGISPYLAPLGGYSYEIGRVSDPGAKVVFASRAAVVGGMLGCTWPLTRFLALGVNVLLVRMLGGKSCMESDAGGTSCGALEKNSTRLGTAQLTLQMAFGRPEVEKGK